MTAGSFSLREGVIPHLPALISSIRNRLEEEGHHRLVDLRSEEICAWRLTLPEGHRFEATQALRQVLNRAVAWELIDFNPAKRGVDNPLRHFPERRPFESWAEIEAVAGKLGRVYGPMVVFAAATGLRPSELFALEQRDVDRGARVVYVRRAYANGRLIDTKTRRSTRAVPLQAVALAALERLPRSDRPFCSFRRRAADTSSKVAYVWRRSYGRRIGVMRAAICAGRQ